MKLGFLKKITFSAVFLALICDCSVFAKSVIPCGNTIGVTLDLNGCLVVETGTVSGGGKKQSPAKSAGIRAGDIIKSINGCEVSSVSELGEIVANCGESEISVVVLRGGNEENFSICPCADENGKYKIGAWVKDALSGIGTLTYVDPETLGFGALGHGIVDSDSGSFAEIDAGNIYKSTIVSVARGESGEPGELKGVFTENSPSLGIVSENGVLGLFGSVNSLPDGEKLETALRDEVSCGEAYILSNVEGDEVGKFKIEITHINRNSRDSKALTIKITDPALIQKTGGIVQGMSGSPIIQNGKLVGAVTHVLVNDPAKGYGIFAETMLGN